MKPTHMLSGITLLGSMPVQNMTSSLDVKTKGVSVLISKLSI
jgi:hypothetical protein